uniref:EFTUD1_0 protein n=1 Tax=Fopius arisanus TaxID=64838 RepID=A0A0C9R9I6_9HYME
MRLVDSSKLSELQYRPSHIRNICILAHVDHGKTTLADSLVASNGIISSKLAGKLRYLDSRPDEQQRGITMKSSSIALYHIHQQQEYLVNIIDSPGHVDFASEVSTAVRLCDGAIIVVDVVEGVCPQTRSALSMAYVEKLKTVLVLNKIDRLITEMKLEPLDAYVHLNQVLEQVNAVMGEIFASDIIEREEKEDINDQQMLQKTDGSSDWQSAILETDDSNLYFSPEQGNVLFTSAADGWGFGISNFAKIFSEKLGFNEKILLKTLWGDYYLNMKAKRIFKGAQEKAKKPLFVSLILENLWMLYDIVTVRKDKERMISMIEKLNIALTTRDLKATDVKTQLQAICSQWLPLSKSCLDIICDRVPAPLELSPEKIERLMSGNSEFSALPLQTQNLKEAFLKSDSSQQAPIIAFVSKMFPVERKMLPEFKTKPLTQEELARRREVARQRHAFKLEQEHKQDLPRNENPEEPSSSLLSPTSSVPPKNVEKTADQMPDQVHETINENPLIAFARVYSGTLTENCEVLILGPKHNPRKVLERKRSGEPIDPAKSLKDLKSGWYVTKVKIPKLYLMMGRELEAVTSVPAGNVLGIGGLEDHVLKTATISTDIMCPSFSELTSLSDPILRVALEPKHPNDLQTLINGLKLLNQADACATMHIQETGEIVLNTAGEVHLERCLEDLKTKYANVEINVSEPIVSFRETVVPPPTVDMVNEAIERKSDEAMLECWTANRQCCFEIDATPLPERVTKLIENNSELIRELDSHWERFGKESDQLNLGGLTLEEMQLGDRKKKAIEGLKQGLKAAFDEAGWEDVLDNILSFGPRKCGPNILLNRTDYKRRAIWEWQFKGSNDPRAAFDSSMINGFQLATLAGPLCEEPMMGVCFSIKKMENS